MRRFIIDTDTGSDDAGAIALMCGEKNIEILALTTVCGNVPLHQATKNALAVLEVCNRSDIPVYEGAQSPLIRPLMCAEYVHGSDGMGDRGLIRPTTSAKGTSAVDYILDTVSNNPDRIEILCLGPVTNIALAIQKDADIMKKVKRIWSMGTAGFGVGNITPVAEFNVYVDAEAYGIMLNSGIDLVIIGHDMCVDGAAFSEEEFSKLTCGGKCARFIYDCNASRIEHTKKKYGYINVEQPDPAAAAVCLWDDMVLDMAECFCYCCTEGEHTYGQVIVYDKKKNYPIKAADTPPNCKVTKKIDYELFKKRMIEVLINI